jgi:Rifampin ADP-ribosyl transferase
VQGKDFTCGQVRGGKLYHGTKSSLPEGTTLKPGHGKNFKQSGEVVSMTSEVGRALMWAQKAGATEPHVYEVEPIGPVTLRRVCPADYGKSFDLLEIVAPEARVLREVPSDSRENSAIPPEFT